MQSEVVAVIGLGYVGLPLAIEFGKKRKTIGFDISEKKIEELKSGFDSTGETTDDDRIAAKYLEYTANASLLSDADILIVAVPTPVNQAHQPDFTPLISASKLIGQNLKSGAIIVYESTVYPGATEEVCIPVIENISSKKWKKDFFIGYSPERINPGDKVHTLRNVTKIVAADTEQTLNKLADTYAEVVDAGLHLASSIKVAEAAKVIENTQRDINIAFMNELAIIFNKIGIDTREVLDAAGTKWNFLKFSPGLVGGHCIGVDPYYLTHKSEMLGYHPEVILAGRRINDSMGKYVADRVVKLMVRSGIHLGKSTVNVFGITFKENCPDIRNSKVPDIVRELESFGIKVNVHDPLANASDANHEYGVELLSLAELPKSDAVVLAVSHSEYLEHHFQDTLHSYLKPAGVIFDVKAVLDQSAIRRQGLLVERL